jgi:hypothetical protein
VRICVLNLVSARIHTAVVHRYTCLTQHRHDSDSIAIDLVDMASLLTPEGGDDAGYWSDASSLPELVSDDSDLDSDSDSDSEESCHSAGRTQHVAAGDAGLGLAARVKGGETVDADDPDVDHSEDLDLDFDLETRTSSDSDTSEADFSKMT